MPVIRSKFAVASVLPTAAMLHDLTFTFPSGAEFRPLAKAPWAGSPELDPSLPSHMRQLGGEFVCVPFGVGGPLEEIAAGWNRDLVQATNSPAHGPAADADWTVVMRTETSIRLELVYPAVHPIRRLTRTITAPADRAAVDLELLIESRVPTRTSVGLHPILDLGRGDRTLSVVAQFKLGLTYPARIPGGGMATAIGRSFHDLRQVPGADGKPIDLSRLPLGPATEDVVQLCGVGGPVDVIFEAEGARLRVDWDREILPSCQLWISDRALQSQPWNGRFRGLGIEPIASAFDFADACSIADNPVSDRGIATAIEVAPDRPVGIRYRLEAFDVRG